MVGVCSPMDAHQNLCGVFTDMPRATVHPFPALPRGFWGCTSHLSVGFHGVLSLHCLGWSWEHRHSVTADNNHADSADGSWKEGTDHIPIAPSTGKAAIRSPLATGCHYAGVSSWSLSGVMEEALCSSCCSHSLSHHPSGSLPS